MLIEDRVGAIEFALPWQTCIACQLSIDFFEVIPILSTGKPLGADAGPLALISAELRGSHLSVAAARSRQPGVVGRNVIGHETQMRYARFVKPAFSDRRARQGGIEAEELEADVVAGRRQEATTRPLGRRHHPFA
ncbi:hypothetical protein DPM13_08920 [Paracoccus mutanolyticus]|uniref:Uncharacterized protein n=1 Tax=Paracoccus mutanolyticus TaxID=1499308 RepID=A0ABM6WRD2_9RHOB|nr:hypothetical protein [Paracoccus mutanolyticus]AWX93213.1 hypothetical protein DPM13_08920 [Paracoccus mutanolyticus]